MISVFIVGDIRLYREGLAELLDHDERIEVLGTTDNHDDALRVIGKIRPRVVLLDMAMPDALVTVRAIRSGQPATRIVALAVPEIESDILACAEAGVSGYVLRQGSLEDLVSTLESVDRGELRCSPRIAATLLRQIAKLAAEQGAGTEGVHLTPRELEILGHIDRGLSNKEISQQLGIEVATVKNHVHNLLEKLHVSRRAEAAARMRGRLPRTIRRARVDASKH